MSETPTDWQQLADIVTAELISLIGQDAYRTWSQAVLPGCSPAEIYARTANRITWIGLERQVISGAAP